MISKIAGKIIGSKEIVDVKVTPDLLIMPRCLPD